MKKLILISFVSILMLGCSTEEPEFNIDDQFLVISNNYLQLNYKGNVNANGILNLTLIVNDQKNAISYDMKIDVSSKGYRLDIANSLKSEAKKLASKISKAKAKLIAETIMEFIEGYDNPGDFKNEKMMGLFYYNSIFNAIYRHHTINQFNSNSRTLSDIQITPYNGYITGLTPFMAKEDIVMDIPHFKNYLNSYSLSRLSKEDINYIINKVGNRSSMSFKDYEDLVHGSLKANSVAALANARTTGEDGCFLLCGGDCGCCANYEGQCYYAAPICYVHDYLCQSCSPSWFCFSGCQPTPC